MSADTTNAVVMFLAFVAIAALATAYLLRCLNVARWLFGSALPSFGIACANQLVRAKSLMNAVDGSGGNGVKVSKLAIIALFAGLVLSMIQWNGYGDGEWQFFTGGLDSMQPQNLIGLMLISSGLYSLFWKPA